MDAVGPSPDLRISLEPRAIARRLAIPAAFAAIAAAALVIAGGPLQTFADALGRALDAASALGRRGGRLRARLLRRLRPAPVAHRRPRLPADEPPREHADHARRRRRHAPAAHGRRRRGGPDAVDAEALGPRDAGGRTHPLRLPRDALQRLPRRDRHLGRAAGHRCRQLARVRRDRRRARRAGRAGDRRVPRARLPRPRQDRRPAPRPHRRPALGRAARRRRRAGRPRHAAPARSARPRGVRLVDLRRRRPVGDAPRVRRTALDRRGRAGVLRRPGRQHAADPGRRERRHRRACSSRSASAPTSRWPPSSPTAPWRSGSRAGIGLATIPSLRATLARWKAEDEADTRTRPS